MIFILSGIFLLFIALHLIFPLGAEKPPPAKPLRRFFTWLFLIIGGLGAAFSGGCTIYFLSAELGIYPPNFNDPYVSIPIILFLGGIPFLITTTIFALGIYLRRKQVKPNSTR